MNTVGDSYSADNLEVARQFLSEAEDYVKGKGEGRKGRKIGVESQLAKISIEKAGKLLQDISGDTTILNKIENKSLGAQVEILTNLYNKLYQKSKAAPLSTSAKLELLKNKLQQAKSSQSLRPRYIQEAIKFLEEVIPMDDKSPEREDFEYLKSKPDYPSYQLTELISICDRLLSDEKTTLQTD
jgi:hypothetical protein